MSTTPVTEPEGPPTPRFGWAAAGFAVCGAAGVALCAAIAGGGDFVATGWGNLIRLGLWAVVWAGAVVCALRVPRRVALASIFVVAAALRLAALAGPPVLSDDLYRYAWDGRVQTQGIDPYRYPPDSAQLKDLRESWLWPNDAGCARVHRAPGCTLLNRASVRTIYPPAAQAWFTAVYEVGGIAARHKAWQVAGLVADLAIVGLLPLVLRAWGRDQRWTALYALSPFPVIEVVNNGHVDGLAALLVVAALWAAARHRPATTGALFGVAVLVKLYPALLLVGLAGAAFRGRRRLRDLATVAAAAGAVVVVGYAPHVAAVGLKVLGYLPGYLREEQYDSGGRYLLASLVAVGGVPAVVLAGTALAAVAAWVVWARPDPARACAALMGTLLLAATPAQPWYGVTLLALATLAAAPAWSLVIAAGYPYFFALILRSPHPIGIGRLTYGLGLAGVVAAAVLRRRLFGGSGEPATTATGSPGEA